MSILRPSRDRVPTHLLHPLHAPPPLLFSPVLSILPREPTLAPFPNCRSSSAAIWREMMSPRGRGWCSLWQSRDMVCLEPIPLSLIPFSLPPIQCRLREKHSFPWAWRLGFVRNRETFPLQNTERKHTKAPRSSSDSDKGI